MSFFIQAFARDKQYNLKEKKTITATKSLNTHTYVKGEGKKKIPN